MSVENTTVFQMGSRFIEISSEAICLNGKERVLRIEVDNAKRVIQQYLTGKKEVYVSDIAEALKLKPSRVIQAIKELKQEGVIKETD